MVQAARRNGARPVIIVDKELIPPEILKDSILLHLASAYIKERRNAEEKLRKEFKPHEISILIRLLSQIAEFKF